MKIVQISSLWETTPPPKYGGLELVVANLTEELVREGHEVALFATGDSQTSAILKSVYPRALYRDGVPWTSFHDTLMHIVEAIKYAKEWGADIIHNHQSHRSLAVMTLSSVPFVNTVHGTLDPKVVSPEVQRTFRFYKDEPFISISNFQRTHAPYLNWIKTVYNGIEVKRFEFNPSPRGDYLLWIGRFTQNKGAHNAIETAKRLGKKLLMAAKLDQNVPKDLEYFNKFIKRELKPGKIEWVGEVGHKEKVELYKDALVFLNPIEWDEPFGLVAPESLACGTPVVAYSRGSMPELIENQKTGFLVPPGDLEAFIQAVKKAPSLNRTLCRKSVEERFTVKKMTQGYLEAYQQAMAAFNKKR